MTRRYVIASDHAGLLLKPLLTELLRERGHSVRDLGPFEEGSVDYPDYALKLAREVAAGEADRGVLICGTGIGVSIAANKVSGVRAALCRSELEAQLARAHNDANVVCIGERITGAGMAQAIVVAFDSEEFEGGRHARRVGKITDYETGNHHQ